MRCIPAVLLLLAAIAEAQQPVIEVRKVRTLIDRDGKGFTRAPILMAPLSQGRYALQEMNLLPIVVDSLGRVVKRFVRGGGPGELAFNATSLSVGAGDTLYVGNQQSFSVFAPDLRFIRSIPLTSVHAGPLVRVPGAFALSAQAPDGPAYRKSIHIMNPAWNVVRSFVRDTFDRRVWPPPSYRVAAASDNNLWVIEAGSHRIEKWSISGDRLSVDASRPAWFDNQRSMAEGRPYVRGLQESDGVLWVMSAVPVANYKAIMAEALKGRGNEVDARLIPEERLSTTRLEAYDARTGKLLADLPINAYGVGLVSGRQFVLYTPGRNDEAQLEIWEMKLRR